MFSLLVRQEGSAGMNGESKTYLYKCRTFHPQTPGRRTESGGTFQEADTSVGEEAGRKVVGAGSPHFRAVGLLGREVRFKRNNFRATHQGTRKVCHEQTPWSF